MIGAIDFEVVDEDASRSVITVTHRKSGIVVKGDILWFPGMARDQWIREKKSALMKALMGKLKRG